MASAAAWAGVFLLAIVAPFEMTRPVVTLPWQSVSNLELALAGALAAWAAALIWTRRMPSWRTPLVVAWLALVGALLVASLAAPGFRTNALHMTGRVGAALAVYLLAVEGVDRPARLRWALILCVVSGVVVGILAVLEYLQVGAVLDALRLFRAGVTAVGAQVRAGGPLQYPTIASMFLEVVFALGLGLLLAAVDDRSVERDPSANSGSARAASRGEGSSRASWQIALVFVSLLVIAEAIALTFTRAGLITMAASLVLVGVLRHRARGFDSGVRLLAALAAVVGALLVTSRSMPSLWLRWTSESQDAWYRAEFRVPAEIALVADRASHVTVTVANTGRLAWDSDGDPPIFLSYHWADPEGARIVAFEGDRTVFPTIVSPGTTVTVDARVRAPRHPGTFRLEWDLVQEGRLWFSTEQGAPAPTASLVSVTGPAVGGPLVTTERPRRAQRPGRFVLWRAAARMVAAHPLLGVGPDNFRLLYGSYAGLPDASPRTHSNNMYLEVLAGGGLLAAAAFAWFFWQAAALFARCLTPVGSGIAAAGLAIALHGTVDSFLSFAPTYILFALTLGFAAACARGAEARADAHRV